MIDKKLAYRFRGDSERWEWNDFSSALANGTLLCNPFLANHLQERGILLEYPELPGEDWEFCEAEEQEMYFNEECGEWWLSRSKKSSWSGIYCRKKKVPVIRGKIPAGESFRFVDVSEAVYWTTDPQKGKELLS